MCATCKITLYFLHRAIYLNVAKNIYIVLCICLYFLLHLLLCHSKLPDVIYTPSEHYMQIRINFAREGGGGGGGRGARRSGATTFRGRQFRTVAWRSSHAFPRFSVCTCVAVLPRPLFPQTLSYTNSFLRSSYPPFLFHFVVALRLIRGPLIRTRGRAFRSVFLYLVNLAYIVLAFSSLFFSFFFPPTTSLSHFSLHARQNARVSLNVIIAWPFGS